MIEVANRLIVAQGKLITVLFQKPAPVVKWHKTLHMSHASVTLLACYCALVR